MALWIPWKFASFPGNPQASNAIGSADTSHAAAIESWTANIAQITDASALVDIHMAEGDGAAVSS